MRAALAAHGDAQSNQSVDHLIIFTMGTMEPEIAEPKAPQDRLSSYFDDSVATVRQKFTQYAPQPTVTHSFDLTLW